MAENNSTNPIGTDSGVDHVASGIASNPAIDAGRIAKPIRKLAGFSVIAPGDAPTIEYAAAGDDGNDAGTAPASTGDDRPKRRGRPPGSRNAAGSQDAKVSANLANLEELLISVHMMGAAFLDTAELALSQDEARQLSSAVREVAKHYSFNVDPKKMALAQLTACVVSIYGPRALHVIQRKPKQQRPAVVQSIRKEPERTQTKATDPFAGITNPSQLWSDAPIGPEAEYLAP